MLRSIYVKNLALIDEEEILLEDGLNILTGETGAGKSILIGSVSAALGTGSLKDLVQEGAESASVELTFETSSEEVSRLLEEMDLPLMDGLVLITRSWRNGRSISRINGETATVAKVREVAQRLIDIHGQHEHQSLLYPKYHLELVDSFADKELGSRKDSCRAHYRDWKETGRELEQALRDERDRVKQIDFLTYEISEIDDAALVEGADAERVLGKLLGLARKNGVRVALATTPYHEKVRAALPRHVKDGFASGMRRLAHGWDVRWLDWLAMELPDEAFLDGTHVNALGGKMLGKALRDAL